VAGARLAGDWLDRGISQPRTGWGGWGEGFIAQTTHYIPMEK